MTLLRDTSHVTRGEFLKLFKYCKKHNVDLSWNMRFKVSGMTVSALSWFVEGRIWLSRAYKRQDSAGYEAKAYKLQDLDEYSDIYDYLKDIRKVINDYYGYDNEECGKVGEKTRLRCKMFIEQIDSPLGSPDSILYVAKPESDYEIKWEVRISDKNHAGDQLATVSVYDWCKVVDLLKRYSKPEELQKLLNPSHKCGLEEL